MKSLNENWWRWENEKIQFVEKFFCSLHVFPFFYWISARSDSYFKHKHDEGGTLENLKLFSVLFSLNFYRTYINATSWIHSSNFFLFNTRNSATSEGCELLVTVLEAKDLILPADADPDYVDTFVRWVSQPFLVWHKTQVQKIKTTICFCFIKFFFNWIK